MLLAKRSLAKEVNGIVKAFGGSGYLPGLDNCYQDSAGTTPCTVDSPVGHVKDTLTGNHATQATAGFKPILRGKVKNYITYSNDFSNAVWNKDGKWTAIPNAGPDPLGGNNAWKASQITGTQYFYRSAPIQVGVTAIFSLYVKKGDGGNDTVRLTFNDGTRVATFNIQTGVIVSTGANATATITNVGNGWYLCAVKSTPTAATNLAYDALGTFSLGQGHYIFGAQVTYSNNLQPYVPTTSAAASSSYGPYWLDFNDNASNRLQLTAVPISTTDDFTIVAAYSQFKASYDTIYGQAAGGASEAYPDVSINTTRFPVTQFIGGGTSVTLTSADAIPQATPFVVSAIKSGVNVSNRVNGVQTATATLSGTYTTPTNAYIGALGRSTITNLAAGSLPFLAILKGNVTTQQRQKLEKYAANLAGVQL